MSKENLSSKQEEILNYIKECLLNKGYPPTVREICQAVNLKSTASVQSHLNKIEEKGYIIRDKTKSRTIEIVGDDLADFKTEVVNIPLLGHIAAGAPILAEQNIESYFPIPAEYISNKTTFMLKVKGDSMINAGIFDGDTIIVESCNTARNGDIIVALIEDSATVKTFYKEKDHIRLQPENDSMDPIIVNDCMILGKYIGLIRMV
ncbi:repressor LexA [Lachnospiraceae bacterium RM5]|nr:repressor LexA [Lachnospiraceae bacterium RM5]